MNKVLIAALAATMTIVTTMQAEAASKKKPVKPEQQTEEDAGKEAMNDLMLDVATGMLAGGLKKGKLPKGGKVLLKNGLKAVKSSAKKESGKKKDPLKALFGTDDE